MACYPQGHGTNMLGAMLPTRGARLAAPLLLVADLDDTLISKNAELDAGSAAFKALWERSSAAGMRCKLAINTGRTLPLFEEAWAEKQSVLPRPDILVAGVGTRCYYQDTSDTHGGWVEDTKWTAQMNDGWDPAQAQAVMDGLQTTFGTSNVVYRPAVDMHDHKLTVLYHKQLRSEVLPWLHSQLEQTGLQATIIEGGSAQAGFQFIDLIPQRAGKGNAMHYVRQRFGFDAASTVAAGDAHNDLDMLQQAQLAIVVGNAAQDIKDWALRAAQGQLDQGTQPLPDEASTTDTQPCCTERHKEDFSLKATQRVYVAQQQVAAGVLEGLHAFGLLTDGDE